MNFKNGDKLLVVNCGCSEYTYVFQFTTSRYSADTTDYKYWYPIAEELMKEVVSGTYKDDPMPVQRGIDTLESFIKHYPNYLTLNKVIYVYFNNDPNAPVVTDDDDNETAREMSPHILISRIQKNAGSEYMVEVTYSIGL